MKNWFQHPSDPLTHFFIFLVSHFVLIALRHLNFGKRGIFLRRTIFLTKMFLDVPLRLKRAFKNFYDVKLRFYMSISAKFSKLPFDLEIGFKGHLRDWESKYRNKNMRCTLEGLRVDFQKLQLCP